MEDYVKIQSLFKRDHKTNKFTDEWSTSEIGYLANSQWDFALKMDGTNVKVGWIGGQVKFGGRTKDAQMPTFLFDALVEMFPASRFHTDHDLVLYGEGYGPKINGGGKYRSDPSFILFDVRVGSYWLNRPDVEDVASKLGIDVVPVIGQGTLYDAIDVVKAGIHHSSPAFEDEGIVARPSVQMFDRKGQRIICKVKGRDFE